MPHPLRWLVLALACVAAPVAAQAECAAAIATAEREHALPPGLLGAIARVESGRSDPTTGRVGPWPWTINAEGAGRFFPTRDAAVAAVRQLHARGVRVVDVGCMQVNLHHHPDAFPTLEAAFDPLTNARYAGLFLRRLHATRGDWQVTAAHYHSQTPELADVYRAKVVRAWTGAAPGAGAGAVPEVMRRAQLARAAAAGRTMTVRFAGKPMTVRIANGRVEAWPAGRPPGPSSLTIANGFPAPPGRAAQQSPPRLLTIAELADALREAPLQPAGD